MTRIYTIGYSNLSPDQFLAVAKDIDVIMDIRSHPTSPRPEFRIENLEVWLPNRGKQYVSEIGLGGWSARHLGLADDMAKVGVPVKSYAGKFPKQRIAAVENRREPSWTNQGLYDYSWFMSLPEFTEAAERLVRLAESQSVAIMCCELLWWKCHRSMVADYLWHHHHVNAIHLQPKLTNHSDAIGNRIERYDPRITESWTMGK